ncbi:hypothetical protein E2C01_022214 [Portunus trituberculatus]|uniref:Uncharacterized protein n=1 Tax=Portunus trituberculatus TaxID=210409 RepID=A0A5B7E5E2_PORTR|nr:hypothetical protein [Portunus trituberculatus]
MVTVRVGSAHRLITVDSHFRPVGTLKDAHLRPQVTLFTSLGRMGWRRFSNVNSLRRNTAEARLEGGPGRIEDGFLQLPSSPPSPLPPPPSQSPSPVSPPPPSQSTLPISPPPPSQCPFPTSPPPSPCEVNGQAAAAQHLTALTSAARNADLANVGSKAGARPGWCFTII